MIFKVSPHLPLSYITAAKKAEKWLVSDIAYAGISQQPKYNHTRKTPGQVASFIKAQANLDLTESSPECELLLLSVPWYKKASYRNTIAVHSHGSISFNPKFLKRDMPDIINTIVHEYMHYIGFSHDGNKPTPYNLGSVPYAVGALAEAWFRRV